MDGRAPSSRNSQRHSRNLEHLKRVQLNGPSTRSSDNVFSSLHATQLVAQSNAVLPAELLATIIDYVAPADLARFARVSRRMQEMVYEDPRWVQKLKLMDAWNEVEARQRFDDAMKRKTEALKANESGNMTSPTGGTRRHAGSVTLFDAGVEEDRLRKSLESPRSPQHKKRGNLSVGFDEHPSLPTKSRIPNAQAALDAFDHVRSIRGHARQEFGKIYAALGPLYYNLANSKSHSDAIVFQTFRDPEQQAKVLSYLMRFSQCDMSQGAHERQQKLEAMIGIFENAVLQEFQHGYAESDIDGRMRRYAHVLTTLNGGAAGVEAFISMHPMLSQPSRVGQPLDCLEAVASGHVDLNPSQIFFERLAATLVKQATIIDTVFPPSMDVLTPFLSRVCNEIVSDFLTTLFDASHDRGIETYVKAVAGTFGQALRLVASLTPTKGSPSDFAQITKQIVTRCFYKHIDLYLTEELELFRSKSEDSVGLWERELSEQEASTESFFMSNISRQAAKRDFLSSFKKVVMMPVNALPTIPLSSPFASAKPTSSRASVNLDTVDTAYTGSRPRTTTLAGIATPPLRPGTPQQERPTTELAAKAAIMNSRLEGIKSLFSIEIALNLTHLAKASIERAALMVSIGNEEGEAAKEQCGNIFVLLLDTLGNRHVKNGFDKAVRHLGDYNPREVRRFREQSRNGELSTHTHEGVEPLVTFLELVNVGDLIQQMLDVFYSQELVANKLVDRDDFLNQAVKEKKKFEQMLDERVAAGLNKGIDVLMDEVEFICATSQTPTDYNPGAGKDDSKAGNAVSSGVVDIGPSAVAKQVVDVVSGHTAMLVGSTDKNMLDVFTQEVGLRLFGALCKHFKRQRISVDGAIKLISDINHYSSFITGLRQKPLLPYYQALREMSQIYLVYIEPPAAYFGSNAKGKRASLLSTKSSPTAVQAKELATIIADTQRYHGIFPAEEVYEFAERRADWYLVKGDVERAMYGVGCVLM